MNPNDQKQQPIGDPKSCLNGLAFLVRVFSTSLEVFFRTGFGERYFGAQAGAAVLAIPFFAIFCPEDDPTGLFVLLIAYLFLLFSHRVDIMRRRKAGVFEHSYYNGFPVLLKWRIFKRTKEEAFKSNAEPFIALLCGILVMPLSEAVGKYVLVAALCMLFSTGLSQAYERVRVLDMRDSYLDQRRRRMSR